jgi:hypothetical protein
LAHAPLLATTLVDGGFETKGAALPVNSYCYDNVAAGDGLCAASAWANLAGNSGVIRSSTAIWGGVVASEGNYFGFVQVTGVLAQSFTATENGTATVSWLDTNRPGYGSLQNYVVSVFDGMSSVTIGSYSPLTGPWVARTAASFALTNGTTYSLRFTGLETADATVFIDNVTLSVAPANVPEPASWALLIAGFGLTGAAMRRRRRALA